MIYFSGSVPPGKHVMFSYNSNSENVVSQIYQLLQKENIPLWFDRKGDQKDCMYKRYEYKDFTYISYCHSAYEPFLCVVWLME